MLSVLTLEQFATKKGLTVRTVRNYIKSGRLPAFKPGRDWLIPVKELARVIEDGRSTSPYNKIRSERMKKAYLDKD